MNIDQRVTQKNLADLRETITTWAGEGKTATEITTSFLYATIAMTLDIAENLRHTAGFFPDEFDQFVQGHANLVMVALLESGWTHPDITLADLDVEPVSE